jgi:histidine triad (HIT) family protein
MNADSLTSSIFSQIMEGQALGVIVYADERCVVLMDAFPMLPGHVLVIPRVEHIHIRELSSDLRNYLFHVASEITQIMAEQGLSCGDANIVINDGKYSGQSVPHVHIHVVPRKPRDGFPLPALLLNLFNKLRGSQSSVEELEKIAIQLRKPLKQALTENL